MLQLGSNTLGITVVIKLEVVKVVDSTLNGLQGMVSDILGILLNNIFFEGYLNVLQVSLHNVLNELRLCETTA